MALTFKDWSFLQGSVGVTDVVATVSAAHSIYGWLGGLDTCASILDKVRIPFTKKPTHLNIDKNVKISGISSQILTSHGLVAFTADDANAAFGGDPRTQLIGLTLCALAHECGSQAACTLLTECLLPSFFDEASALTDGLAAQLNDNSLRMRILNEGASRGLTERLHTAIDQLRLPTANTDWMRRNLKASFDGNFQCSEIQFVGGFLKWIVQDGTRAYRTRSALVARVAACLRAVGYPIGDIRVWDGVGPAPAGMNNKSLLLVVGGTVSTDPLMLGVEEIPLNPLLLVHHYNDKTIGSLFLTALYHQSDSHPEVFQSLFEETQRFMEKNNTLIFEMSTGNISTRASRVGVGKRCKILRPAWNNPRREHNSPIARRLAGIYFPLIADFIAPCYDSIATQDTLKQILDHKSARDGDDVFPSELAFFRVISASIVFSMGFHLMDNASRKRKHCTGLFLGSEDWLLPMCRILDSGYYHGLRLDIAAFVLAVIHSAVNPEEGAPESGAVIGWRSNSYTVIPSLLAKMDLRNVSPEFCCLDLFVANIKTYEDGSIRDANSAWLFRLEDAAGESGWNNSESVVVHQLASNWIGPPRISEPDVPLYLSFENPRHYSSMDLCLAARIGGVVVGTVSICDVLNVLISSSEGLQSADCQGCETSRMNVFNVRPSEWVNNARYKPIARGMPTLVAVKGDSAWALFLAGQAEVFNGRVVFGCVGCVLSKQESSDYLLIGYG